MPKSKFAELAKSPEQKADELMEIITKNIKKLMREDSINQETLAMLTGIKQGGISKRFNKRTHYTFKDLMKFSKALRVDFKQLLK